MSIQEVVYYLIFVGGPILWGVIVFWRAHKRRVEYKRKIRMIHDYMCCKEE